MSVIVVLDNSFSMGFIPNVNNIKWKEENCDKRKSTFCYAKKGLIAFFKTIRKVSIKDRSCLLTSSPKLSLEISFTTKINKIIKKLLNIDICGEIPKSTDYFNTIDQFISNNCEIQEKINLIIVTDVLGAEIESQLEYPLKSSLSHVSTTIISLNDDPGHCKQKPFSGLKKFQSIVCPFKIKEINKLLREIALEICNSLPFIVKIGNLTSPVSYLYPPLNPDIVASGCKENGTFLLNTAGFLDEEDVVFPVIESKHAVICRSSRATEDFTPNILYLLQSCLHRQKAYCLVSVGVSRYGLIFCAKKKTQINLILFLLPKDQYLPWLGPWEQLGSSADLLCNVYSVGQNDTESSPFPIIEGIECSYFDSDIDYLLKKPNIEEDVYTLINSLKSKEFNQANFITNFEKLKNTCQLYAIPEVIQSILKFIEETISSEFDNSDLQIIKNLYHEIKASVSLDTQFFK